MKVKLTNELGLIKIVQLDLSVRSQNALRSRKVSTLGELVQLSERELLKTKNLGRRSLEEIRNSVAEILSANGVSQPPFPPPEHKSGVELEQWVITSESEVTSPGGWRIPQKLSVDLGVSVDLLDLSARASNVLRKCNIATVWELLLFSKRKLLKIENMGVKSVREIESKVSQLLSSPDSTPFDDADIGTAPSPPNEIGIKGFVEKLISRLPERQKDVIADRYGLWDGIAETLQDIGDKCGLTRERIRQIESQALKRLGRLCSHGAITKFVAQRITPYLVSDEDDGCGLIGADEAINILAGQDPPGDAILALEFLQDVSSSGKPFFSQSFTEVEPGVYSLSEEAAEKYREVSTWIERSLDLKARPITENELLQEVIKTAGRDLSPRQMRTASRVLSISPCISLLINGTVSLSHWKESVPRDPATAAEAILKLIGRPAHYREITERALLHFKGIKISESSIRIGIQAKRNTFVWVKPGTYGLTAWGLTRPPFIKDRLCELLSSTQYPLPFWHLEEKVLEVCNCKKASVRMTLELNRKLFRKFDGDQFGLVRHYAQGS